MYHLGLNAPLPPTSLAAASREILVQDDEAELNDLQFPAEEFGGADTSSLNDSPALGLGLDGIQDRKQLTYMEIDESFEYGRLKQRYLLRPETNTSEIQADVLRVEGEEIAWNHMENDGALFKHVEAEFVGKKGIHFGIFLRSFEIGSMRLDILSQLATMLRIPWVFLTSVLLGHAAGNTVYIRKNADGEGEFVMFSLLAHTRPHGMLTYECLLHNRSRGTTVYVGINYPEFFLDDLRKLLRADPRVASPSLLILLPQILLARSVLRELDVSERHASQVLHGYEEDFGEAKDFTFLTERTHEFFWELYRSMAKVRRYIEYLKMLLTAHELLSSPSLSPTDRVSSSTTLTPTLSSTVNPPISNFTSTQATPYLHHLLSETSVLSSLFTNYISRTKILINHLFHSSAQKDRQLNCLMAEETAQIAVDTRHDSYAMRTISILTMLFLPGTFVSAVFGMSFFENAGAPTKEGAGGGGMGGLWVYFVITVPLTGVVFGCWFWWLKRAKSRGRALSPVGSRVGTALGSGSGRGGRML